MSKESKNARKQDNEMHDKAGVVNDETAEKELEVTGEDEQEAKSDLEIKELQEKLDAANDKYLRLSAEFDNYRKRTLKEKAELTKSAGEQILEKILPVMDNFERALSIKQEGTEKFLEGFKMIYDNLQNILSSKGVTEIECIHKEFDPNMMNAVMTDTNNDFANNIVLECLQKGYMYQDKIIRPAMVKVNERDNSSNEHE